MTAVTVDIAQLSNRALFILLLEELKGLRMDVKDLKPQLDAMTQQLKEATAALATSNQKLDDATLVIGKVTDEETGLLVRIQTLLDTLNNATALPPDVAAAMADANNAMADTKAAVAKIGTSVDANAAAAAGADALVPDGSAGG